jgi:hypothetical protein
MNDESMSPSNILPQRHHNEGQQSSLKYDAPKDATSISGFRLEKLCDYGGCVYQNILPIATPTSNWLFATYQTYESNESVLLAFLPKFTDMYWHLG